MEKTVMDKKTAEEKWRQASALCANESFSEAIELLRELDWAFPGSKNIMIARIRCAAKLGLYDEGKIVYDLLGSAMSSSEAQQLRSMLRPPLLSSVGIESRFEALGSRLEKFLASRAAKKARSEAARAHSAEETIQSIVREFDSLCSAWRMMHNLGMQESQGSMMYNLGMQGTQGMSRHTQLALDVQEKQIVALTKKVCRDYRNDVRDEILRRVKAGSNANLLLSIMRPYLP